MSDDMTFCGSECDRTDCPRHPSNIRHYWLDHSFSDFRGTDYCIDAPKNAKHCFLCGRPVKDGVQYVVFKRGIEKWNWPWHVEGLGGRAGSPAFCTVCLEEVTRVVNSLAAERKKCYGYGENNEEKE